MHDAYFIEKGKLEIRYKLYMSMIVCPLVILGVCIYTLVIRANTNPQWKWYKIWNKPMGKFPITPLQMVLMVSAIFIIQCIGFLIIYNNNRLAFLQGVL